MSRILLLLALLFTAPLWAATLPGVPASTADQSSSSEPDLAQKKAAYGALADVLENADARQELIEQLRKAAATPPPDSTPKLTPPEIKDETTVLENVTQISREYGEQLSSRFSQLWRNITGSPHKAFNSQTFTSAAWHFLLLAGLVFAFWWLVRLAALPLYRKMGHWGRHKTATAATGFSYLQPSPARLFSTCFCWRSPSSWASF